MKATTETLNQLSTFEDNLLKAFRKLIMGNSIELSEKGKTRLKPLNFNVDEPFYITAIREDETMQIMNRSQQFSVVTISEIIL